MEKTKETKALLIEIPKEIHAKIKSLAASRNITLRKFILRFLIAEISKHEEYNKD